MTVDRLDQWVTQQAARRPEAGAVVLGDERLTYGQLESLSNRLARCLLYGGCRRGDRIGLLMPKSTAAIAGIIAIYKAGGIYVPLDPSGPAKRLATILHSCEPARILAAGPVGGLLDELFRDSPERYSTRVGWIEDSAPEGHHFQVEFGRRDLEGFSASPVDPSTTRHDPAHIFYTSGSTGTPKGVVISHANVLQFVEWAIRHFQIGPDERISGHSPLHFDLSMFDIFGTFAAGAELFLVPAELNLLPNRLAQFIRSAELTQWFSVPSILNYMAKFDVIRRADFPRLLRLMWCGEVFPTPALIYWMERLPHVRFTNLYGPTETCIASSHYTVPRCPDDETAAIPIGTACPGEELLVLGDDLRPLPPGEAGQLYIRGVGLSPGYWRDPERTRAVFLGNPQDSEGADRLYKTGDLARVDRDGLVFFLGRDDTQVKSRGYRIELGEIESALSTIECLREAAVVAVPTEGFEGISICCGYVPLRDRIVTPAMLRRELSRSLPPYMLPGRWLALEELPKNANGKIDRRRIKEAFQQARQEREAQAH